MFLKFVVSEDVFFHHRLGFNRGSFSVFPFPGSEYSPVIYDAQERITASVVAGRYGAERQPVNLVSYCTSESERQALCTRANL